MTQSRIFFKIVYWILFIAAILAFWISLRTETQEIEFTFLALGLWAIAFYINRKYLQKKK